MANKTWRKLSLGEVITFQRGYDLPHKDRKHGTIPIISSSGNIDTHNEARATGPGVVTGRYGTIGEVFFVSEDFWPLNTTLFVRDFKGNNPLFISFLLRTIDYQSYSGKSGVPGVNRNDLHEISVNLPPLPEQQAIATALSNIDALITSLDKLIAKKRDIKQATMQQLLTGKMRLPGFSDEWKMKTFGEVMTGFVSGATPSRGRPDFFKGNIRWITSGELNYNVIMDTIEKISIEAVSRTNLKLLPKGTFLMAITGLEAEGTRGSCGIVGAEATTNQSCMALFPTKELSTDYLFHYYTYKGKSLALEYCQGTKQQSYTGKIVKLLPILLPPRSEQQAIATVLSDMDAEIVALEQKREKTLMLKQGMMQELLTGKTRLI